MTNEQAYVEATDAPWWTVVSPQRRQELALGGGAVRVDARVAVHEINDLLDIDLPHEDWTSVGGLVFNLLGRVPDPGETVDVRVTLSNAGLAAAGTVSGILSTETPGISITQDSADFGDLPVGGEVSSSVDYTFAVDQAVGQEHLHDLGHATCGVVVGGDEAARGTEVTQHRHPAPDLFQGGSAVFFGQLRTDGREIEIEPGAGRTGIHPDGTTGFFELRAHGGGELLAAAGDVEVPRE